MFLSMSSEAIINYETAFLEIRVFAYSLDTGYWKQKIYNIPKFLSRTLCNSRKKLS